MHEPGIRNPRVVVLWNLAKSEDRGNQISRKAAKVKTEFRKQPLLREATRLSSPTSYGAASCERPARIATRSVPGVDAKNEKKLKGEFGPGSAAIPTTPLRENR